MPPRAFGGKSHHAPTDRLVEASDAFTSPLSPKTRRVAECLGNITFVGQNGAAQQLRFRWLEKILAEEKDNYEKIRIG